MRPVLLLIILLLGGCGQLGPLYLPTSLDTGPNNTDLTNPGPNVTAADSDDVHSDDASSNNAEEPAEDSAEASQ